MSIIQQIREKYAAVGFGFIALSLIAFILMDANKRGGGGSGPVSDSDAIGEINGNNISYGEFSKRTKQMEANYARQGQPITEDTRQQINAETWRSMVEGKLMDGELAKLGLTVTDKEFNDMLFGKNPPADLKQAFTDPKTGVYDAAVAKQQLAQQKKTKGEGRDQLEEYFAALIENAKAQKYNALLQSSAYAPTWLAAKTMADNSAIANFSYVAVPYTSISDSAVKISDDQINTYVQAHKIEFKQDENTRSIAYAGFSFLPSAADTAATLKTVEGLKESFKAAADPASFIAREASALPFYDGYKSLTKIKIPQKDSIVAAGVGNIYGPYLDGNSYVISRVVDVKSIPDSAKCRHILVKIADEKGQYLSDSAAKKRIDSVKTAIDAGADFDNIVRSVSDDEGSKGTKGEYTFSFDGFDDISKEFGETVFYGKTGDKKIVKVQNQKYIGYHYIEVLQQYSPETSYKIAYMSKQIEPSQETINDAQNLANAFYSKSKDIKAFDAAVLKDNINKMVAGDIKENDFQIQGLGTNRKLVKEVFEKDPGTVLEPEELDNQYVVIAITGAQSAGVMSAAKARPQVENILRNQEKAKQISAKIGKPASLEAVAQAQSVTVQRADSISFASPMLPGAGFEPKVGGYAFSKTGLNKISPAIGGNSGVFVIKADAIGARSDVGSTVEATQLQIANQQKNSATYTSMQALRNAAKIKDKRSKFPI